MYYHYLDPEHRFQKRCSGYTAAIGLHITINSSVLLSSHLILPLHENYHQNKTQKKYMRLCVYLFDVLYMYL